MADEPQGPGWWQASDGKWYPPELHPDAPPAWSPPAWAPPPVEPPKRTTRRGVAIAATVVAVLVVALVAVFALGTKSDKKTGATASSDATDISDATDATGSVSIPEGYSVLTANGVSIAAPSEWTKVDASDFSARSDALSDLANANTDASDLLGFGADVLAKNAKLAARAPSGRQLLAVVKIPVAFDPTDPFAKDQMSATLEGAGATGIELSEITLAAGQALRVTATLTLNVPNGGTVTETEVSYLVRVKKATYEVTMVAVGDASTDDFDTMAKTFAVD